MPAGQVEITVHIISRCYGTADSRDARLVRLKPILIALPINKLYYRLIAKRISDARAVHPYDSDLVFASIQWGLNRGGGGGGRRRALRGPRSGWRRGEGGGGNAIALCRWL